MFVQVFDMIDRWSISRADAIIWIITCLSVILIDIDYGLIIGVMAALVLLIIRNQNPVISRLGIIPGTDIYLDVEKYNQVCPGLEFLRPIWPFSEHYGCIKFHIAI